MKPNNFNSMWRVKYLLMGILLGTVLGLVWSKYAKLQGSGSLAPIDIVTCTNSQQFADELKERFVFDAEDDPEFLARCAVIGRMGANMVITKDHIYLPGVHPELMSNPTVTVVDGKPVKHPKQPTWLRIGQIYSAALRGDSNLLVKISPPSFSKKMKEYGDSDCAVIINDQSISDDLTEVWVSMQIVPKGKPNSFPQEAGFERCVVRQSNKLVEMQMTPLGATGSVP